jgi:hypothetical protein
MAVGVVVMAKMATLVVVAVLLVMLLAASELGPVMCAGATAQS